ncbi:MAG: dTMP kinase [Sphaerochaeta sp.]|nr:dTMP kinase [Sphaerochaeta sp.]
MSPIFQNLVVFEGLDGSGTTTQMQLLAEKCDRELRACRATFEPTDKPIGRLVRAVLKKQIVTTPLALAMLYAADREDHLYNPIYGMVSEMEKGKLVICDRYIYSSLAYQGVECPIEKVRELNQFPAPKYLFFIDTPVGECIRRIEARGGDTELFDRHEFLEQVKSNYERLFSELSEEVRFYRLDGMQSKEAIAAEIQKVMFTE